MTLIVILSTFSSPLLIISSDAPSVDTAKAASMALTTPDEIFAAASTLLVVALAKAVLK